MLKSVTGTEDDAELFAVLVSIEGGFTLGVTPTVPLVVSDCAEVVGVNSTVTVAVAPFPKVPIRHCTELLTAVAQLPGELLVVPAVAPLLGKVAVKLTPDVGSGPLFVIVYLNVSWLPTPIGLIVGVTVTLRSLTPPSFVMKASLGPCNAPWNAVPRTGKLPDAVSPATYVWKLVSSAIPVP
jgi:hypothetical protein